MPQSKQNPVPSASAQETLPWKREDIVALLDYFASNEPWMEDSNGRDYCQFCYEMRPFYRPKKLHDVEQHAKDCVWILANDMRTGL